MSKVNATGVTYMQRETALHLTPMKATLGINQVHADFKGEYNTYINARRALMNQYIPATFANDGGSAARKLSQQIQALDTKFTLPKVSTTTKTRSTISCENVDVVIHDEQKQESRAGVAKVCVKRDVTTTTTTGGALKQPQITRQIQLTPSVTIQ